jgi:hypothetical protein
MEKLLQTDFPLVSSVLDTALKETDKTCGTENQSMGKHKNKLARVEEVSTDIISKPNHKEWNC